MAIGFPLGIDDYKKLRTSGAIYVDKSMMLQEVIQDTTESFLITRPRRFGKTINMSMIKYFFDIRDADENRKLFENTLIAKATYEFEGKTLNCMDEQGQYPVIFISLKGLVADNYAEMLLDIGTKMKHLYAFHNYLLESNKLSNNEKSDFEKITSGQADVSTLKFSLFQLTTLLEKHYGRKVILLVDEYDKPMHSAYSCSEPYDDKLRNFFETFFGDAFKTNTAIKKSIMTGILRISLMNLFSGVNNVIVRSVLDSPYGQYFGFSEEEVMGLFKQLDRKQDQEKVKAWYNGYKFGDATLYNPWSILNCLADKQGKFMAYWVGTGDHGVLGKALISCTDFEVFSQLKKLLNGETIQMLIDERTIFSELHGSQTALWNLMLYSGYLTAVRSWEDEANSETHVEVRLPNREVNLSMKRMVKDWIALSATKSINSELMACLTTGDAKKFGEIVQRYILETISFYDFSYNTEERFYHIFMLGMFVGFDNQFIIDSNRESGFGRYDIILIPKDKKLIGIVIELKSVEITSQKQARELKDNDAMRADLLEAEALDALVQIEKRAYGVRFAQHDIKKYVAIGLAFLGKEVSVRSNVIDS